MQIIIFGFRASGGFGFGTQGASKGMSMVRNCGVSGPAEMVLDCGTVGRLGNEGFRV